MRSTENHLRWTASQILLLLFFIFTSIKPYWGVFQFLPYYSNNVKSFTFSIFICEFLLSAILLKEMLSGHVLGRNSVLYRAVNNCKDWPEGSVCVPLYYKPRLLQQVTPTTKKQAWWSLSKTNRRTHLDFTGTNNIFTYER